jgi:hypothetical protein
MPEILLDLTLDVIVFTWSYRLYVSAQLNINVCPIVRVQSILW